MHIKTFIMGILTLLFLTLPGRAQPVGEAPVYVFIWFDTEDYILPEADDALLHLTRFLTQEGVRATFKVVGEKARVLEARHRDDVLQSLIPHAVGYHTNFHSGHPTPAEYLSPLGWTDGVVEFLRRESGGLADVTRITGQKPVCYGQPGSSWGPQQMGGLLQWGVPVYLDAGEHVSVNEEPFWYGGILNLYSIRHTLRTELDSPTDVDTAREAFREARADLAARGGGIVSVYYHPCEFVHEQFWDAANFAAGANPPPEEWKRPPLKSEAQIAQAFENFEQYVRFLKSFPDVQFVTADQAPKLYRDTALGHRYSADELVELAHGVLDSGPYFQTLDGRSISAAEALYLLAHREQERLAGEAPRSVSLPDRPLLGANAAAPVFETVTTSRSQFNRTVADVVAFMETNQRVPDAVWLGSQAVSPEAFLMALAAGAADGAQSPTVTLKPAELVSARHVRTDQKLWGWVIFPPGFDAPAMMELARRQAWSLKPALPAWR